MASSSPEPARPVPFATLTPPLPACLSDPSPAAHVTAPQVSRPVRLPSQLPLPSTAGPGSVPAASPGRSLPRCGTLQACLLPPDSSSKPLPSCKLFVDLFAGASAPLSANLCSLACSGIVAGGPLPVRTPQFPTGIPSPSPTQAAELRTSSLLHERARHCLALVAAHGGLIILENPSSSLLWLDPAVRSWLAVHAPYCCHVAACQYGLPLPKAWAFWASHPVLEPVSCKCPHPPRFHPSFAGKRNPDGSFASRQTACYPDALAAAIARQVAPFLSVRQDPVSFADWSSLLPSDFVWPCPSSRIEDGAGTCSSAFWGVPREPDILKPLRSAWLARFQTPGLLSGLLAHLVSPSKEAPLSDTALQPFLADLRAFLHIDREDVWRRLLHVDPGQPFRLNLWHCLSVLVRDPDMDFFKLLHEAVPLGIGQPIPACKVLFPPDPPSESVTSLQHCDSAWKSALDHAELVDELLQTELHEGWIRPVPGGDQALRNQYARTAVGKLGVVVSPDRPPRLVVDSSISGVTSNTSLPNKAPNPNLTDVRRCLPFCPARQQLVALVLDVSKAHRRIRIRPEDQGLLCFRHRDVLYQSVTLNFGARASGFYWNRLAGLLVRLTHRFWHVRHSAQIYVDDLLAMLLRSSAPLLAAVLIVLLQILRVPMSWHKAALSSQVIWIGWAFDFEHFTVSLDPDKMRHLLVLLRQLRASPKCNVTTLEKLTGKLLWLSNLFSALRPSLAPLYLDQHCPVPNMCAISPDLWSALRASLSPDLKVTRSLPLAAIPVGCKLLRYAHTPVTSLSDLPEVISSRRVWVQVVNPLRPDRELSPESCEVVDMWLHIASSPCPFRSLFLRPLFVCEAFADACADSSRAGFGGFIRLPDSRQACFSCSFPAEQLADMFAWFPLGTSPQHCIAAWEMLVQVGLLWTLSVLLPPGHVPFHVVFRTDNSPSQSAAWKGLSLARGMCQFLRAFNVLQETVRISVHLDAVPGFLNDIADALSRGVPPSALGFQDSEVLTVPWTSFSSSPALEFFPSADLMSQYVADVA